MKTLLIDNYDSFTYNLYQELAALGGSPVVVENDKLKLSDLEKIDPSHIVISPGPGTVEKKEDFGICEDVIRAFAHKTPILGVCLGHQGIAKLYGAKIHRAPQIIHGKQSLIEHDGTDLFTGIQNPFKAMRYHSLCVSEENFPQDLKTTARTQNDRTIMALQHREHPLFGIQFHPESFGTSEGHKILSNFFTILLRSN